MKIEAPKGKTDAPASLAPGCRYLVTLPMTEAQWQNQGGRDELAATFPPALAELIGRAEQMVRVCHLWEVPETSELRIIVRLEDGELPAEADWQPIADTFTFGPVRRAVAS